MHNLNSDTQVVIYFDDQRGQLLQVTYQSWLDYWRLIGWRLQGPVPELPLGMKPNKQMGLQNSLF
jgi:hypothetical protein